MKVKSEWAFNSTVNGFRQYCDDLKTGMFFWTFTLRKDFADSSAPYVFRRVINQVYEKYRDEVPLFAGVRVIQRQPGSGRAHWHALVNKRIPIDWLQDIGWEWGLGWCWVERVDNPAKAVGYLSRYFQRTDEQAWRVSGMPVWGTIGHAPFRTTCADIKIETPYTKFLSRVRREVFGGQSMPNWLAKEIFKSWHLGYQEREDFIIWYAKERDWLTWEAWEPLSWTVWLMQQELQGIGERDLDGRMPF